MKVESHCGCFILFSFSLSLSHSLNNTTLYSYAHITFMVPTCLTLFFHRLALQLHHTRWAIKEKRTHKSIRDCFLFQIHSLI